MDEFFLNYPRIFIFHNNQICLITIYAIYTDIRINAEIEYKISDTTVIPGIVYKNVNTTPPIKVPADFGPTDRFKYIVYTELVHPSTQIFEVATISNKKYYIFNLDHLLEAKKYIIVGKHVFSMDKDGNLQRATKGINYFTKLYLSKLEPFIVRYTRV